MGRNGVSITDAARNGRARKLTTLKLQSGVTIELLPDSLISA
jgi:hypothetical protein